MLLRKSETRTTPRVDCTLIAHDDACVWSIQPAADQLWQQVISIAQSERRDRKRRDGTYRYYDYDRIPRIQYSACTYCTLLRRVIKYQNSSLCDNLCDNILPEDCRGKSCVVNSNRKGYHERQNNSLKWYSKKMKLFFDWRTVGRMCVRNESMTQIR